MEILPWIILIEVKKHEFEPGNSSLVFFLTANVLEEPAFLLKVTAVMEKLIGESYFRRF